LRDKLKVEVMEYYLAGKKVLLKVDNLAAVLVGKWV